MKIYFKIGLFFLLLPIHSQDIGFSNILKEVYPDKNEFNYPKNYKVNTARNSYSDVNIIIKTKVGDIIDFNAYSETLNNIQFNNVKDVPIEENTGLDSRTEQFKGLINPHVIRRAPFRVFEILKPVHNNITAETKYSLLNLKIYIPEKIDSGNHFVNLSFKIGSKTFDLKLKVNVYDYIIPKLSESNFFYTNWFNLGKMEEYHGVKRWTDEWYIMLDKYAKIMAEGRQNCIIIPGELIYYSDGEFQLDEQKMISFINIFRKYGFKYFESPHLLNRGANDDWGNPELKTRLKKVGYYSDEGKNEIASIIYKIRDFTEKYKLKNQWLQHIADEPTSINAQCYVDVAKQIKEIYPEIKIMEATNTRDSLGDAIDIWCPIINDFQENLDFFREREKKGEKILVYTCLVPGGKWLNRTLDMEKLRQVYFGWGGSKYNTLGYLHWGLNQYKADPFKQSVVKHPSPAASSNNYLPAGDTHVIYPGKNGPLSSLRFEAHRIGAEDYEMLESLKFKNSKIHKKLINKIFKNYTDYSLNINKYLRVKKKLLKSLTT